MPDPQEPKARLRAELRRRRLALDRERQALAAAGVCRQVATLPRWASARSIALYLAADGEVDTGPLAALAREQGKALYLPVISPSNHLHFAEWRPTAPLAANRYGIGEPPHSAARRAASELDIICLPLVGWDRRGGRLGMGGGYYDRSLAGLRGPLLLGLAHALQEVDEVPMADWDVRLDCVATDCAFYDCRGEALP